MFPALLVTPHLGKFWKTAGKTRLNQRDNLQLLQVPSPESEPAPRPVPRGRRGPRRTSLRAPSAATSPSPAGAAGSAAPPLPAKVALGFRKEIKSN